MAVHGCERLLCDEYAERRLARTRPRKRRPAKGRCEGHRLLDVPRATSGAPVNAYENARRIALASGPTRDVVHHGAATQVPRRSRSIGAPRQGRPLARRSGQLVGGLLVATVT